MKLKLPAIFGQRDPAWASKILGYNTNPVYSIGDYGCLITSFGMYINQNPDWVNEKLKANSGFAAGTGNFIWAKCTVLGLNQTYQSPFYSDPVTTQGIAKMRALLDEGKPLITHIDFDPRDVDDDQHWLIVYGYDANDVFYAADPWSGTLITLDVYGGVARCVYEWRTYDKILPKQEEVPMAVLLGNDVSKWQGDIDWNTYKNNSNFCIIKSSEGTGYTDTKFSRNQSEARRVGLPLGYYHFARPDLNNSAEAEAAWFLQVLGEIKPGELLTLDYEANWSGDVVRWCKIFLDYVYNATKCRPLIYLNQSTITAHDWQPVVDGGYGLWVAAYTYDPYKNNFITGKWNFAAMQQWTNQQQVPGILGNVDGNVFFGDLATFKKYGYPAPVPPPPVEPPPVEPPPVEPPPVEPPVDPCLDVKSKLAEMTTKYEAQAAIVKRAHDILYGTGFWWTKLSRLKTLIPK